MEWFEPEPGTARIDLSLVDPESPPAAPGSVLAEALRRVLAEHNAPPVYCARWLDNIRRPDYGRKADDRAGPPESS